MNKAIKVIVATAAIAGYYLLLRYIAPSRDPYFILGIAVIGYAAWLLGIGAGVATAALLTPLTYHIYDGFDVSISYSSFALSPAFIGLQLFVAVSMGTLRRRVHDLTAREDSLLEVNETLQGSLSQVREMGGIHSLCTSCKSILDDDGTWKKIDTYLKEKTKAEFSHGICPECARKIEIPPTVKEETAAEEIDPADDAQKHAC